MRIGRRIGIRTVLPIVLPIVVLAPCARDAAARQDAPLTVTPLWPVEQFVSGREPLEFELSRRPDAPMERLAVVVGTVDVSALVELRGTRATFRPTAIRLPSGTSDVAAFVVDSTGAWREIGRFPLNVRTRLGLDQGRVVPSADLSSTGPLAIGVPDGDPEPERSSYQDLTLRFGFSGEFAREQWKWTTQANAIGVTQETHRLRYGEMQADAPAIDLSDYRVLLERGVARVRAGNQTVNNHRLLLSSFSSRGIGAGVRFGNAVTIDGAVANGTNVVGWTNPFGLDEPAHRMHSLTVALELMPSRPGAVHIGLNGFDGSVLPVSSFNQGAATDAEESRGIGVDLAISDSRQRFRFAGGFARSTFDNPIDPLLSRDTAIVLVRATTRMARYGELGVQLLQGASVTPSIPASLGLTIRHERVDPLYRSVGAYVQSDIENYGLDVNGSVGPLSLQASSASSRDNLDDIESILTTRTGRRGINGALATGTLVGADYDDWYWPNLSASWQRVHQVGDGVPDNGGFSASHVPDQVSTTKSARLDWRRGQWNASWGWNGSHQDNRQPDREQADFRSTVHSIALGLTPSTRISVGVDISIERQSNLELDNTQRVERLGLNTRLQVTQQTTASGSVSQSWGVDPFAEARTRNTEFNIEVAQGFTVWGRRDAGSQGRMFLRYARTRAAFSPFDAVSGAVPRISWTLNAGASLRLY